MWNSVTAPSVEKYPIIVWKAVENFTLSHVYYFVVEASIQSEDCRQRDLLSSAFPTA